MMEPARVRYYASDIQDLRNDLSLGVAVRQVLWDSARQDERTIERWLLGGMKGRLIRHHRYGALSFDPDDGHVGEWLIEVHEGHP